MRTQRQFTRRDAIIIGIVAFMLPFIRVNFVLQAIGIGLGVLLYLVVSSWPSKPVTLREIALSGGIIVVLAMILVVVEAL